MNGYLIPILVVLGLLLAMGLAIAAIYIEFPENGVHAAPRRQAYFDWSYQALPARRQSPRGSGVVHIHRPGWESPFADRLDLLIARYNLPAVIVAELDDTHQLLGRARLALTAAI